VRVPVAAVLLVPGEMVRRAVPMREEEARAEAAVRVVGLQLQVQHRVAVLEVPGAPARTELPEAPEAQLLAHLVLHQRQAMGRLVQVAGAAAPAVLALLPMLAVMALQVKIGI
jgi:hypothetical protein